MIIEALKQLAEFSQTVSYEDRKDIKEVLPFLVSEIDDEREAAIKFIAEVMEDEKYGAKNSDSVRDQVLDLKREWHNKNLSMSLIGNRHVFLGYLKLAQLHKELEDTHSLKIGNLVGELFCGMKLAVDVTNPNGMYIGDENLIK